MTAREDDAREDAPKILEIQWEGKMRKEAICKEFPGPHLLDEQRVDRERRLQEVDNWISVEIGKLAIARLFPKEVKP